MGRDERFNQMATFTFIWDMVKKVLEIIRRGTKSIKKYSRDKRGAGCGRYITWREMAIVQPPVEWSDTAALVKTSDVPMLPECASATRFNRDLDETLKSFQDKMIFE